MVVILNLFQDLFYAGFNYVKTNKKDADHVVAARQLKTLNLLVK
ncbi:hypothetical protein SRABI27_03162 [Pedobacter sp. Bi27]|nr:hypothetical protein SRABI36_00623 [Pedobacter sp. Bi36]CAH0258740.1 hypothetical protein SRABI27_03162 [Pedobacter sp. Bi27]